MKMPKTTINGARRNWIKQAGALAGSASVPLLGTSALSFAQSKLVGLSRIALVIGNTRYHDAPLKNPVNDAKAIAGELQQTGFRVNLQLDAGRNQMSGAIQAFTDELAKTKGVGLFYYAGHGAQLAWRNYLIPVDAAIEKLEDMRERTVELAALLQGLHKASNPMNVIILDACRDNPFGTRVPTEAKGLSQFDAPPGSLLAYATSPGNTAGDGDGVNGLYTENLLRELKVPGAKIEDVFKRVRLAVRRRSEGQQIPWESTSLEDDFYFLPPQHFTRQSDTELEKAFEDELALWQKIKDSKKTEPLEEYLRNYPSGQFSELAQYRLDKVLKALGETPKEITGSNNNPFSKGIERIDTRFKIGESWSYRETNLTSGAEIRQFTNTITEISETEVRYNDGKLVTDLFGNFVRRPPGWQYTDAQFYVHEYVIGKRWATRFKTITPGRLAVDTEYEFRVTGRESITTPAGNFAAFRIEGVGTGRSEKGVAKLKYIYWIAQGIKRPVASEFSRRLGNGKLEANERIELTSFTQL